MATIHAGAKYVFDECLAFIGQTSYKARAAVVRQCAGNIDREIRRFIGNAINKELQFDFSGIIECIITMIVFTQPEFQNLQA